MINSSFPIKYGFTYHENLDEFRLDFGEGYFVIWEFKNKWELSYVDKDDYQKFIKKGNFDDLSNILSEILRDKKIDSIIG